MCRRGRLDRLERRQRRQPLLQTLGKLAYDTYQESQNRQRQITIGAVLPKGSGPAPGYHQEPSVRARRRDSHIDTHQPLVTQVGNVRHMDEAMKGAPPSYEESLGQQTRGVVRAPQQTDVKRKPVPTAQHIDNDDDDSSDVSSLFQTEGGVMTPTTEMEANQGRTPNDLLARATQSLSLQDDKRSAPANATPRSRNLGSQGRRPGNPNMEAAQISSIAHWLSQHDSASEPSVGERAPQGRATAPSSHTAPQPPSGPPPRQDSFEGYWQKHPEHRPENLGMSRLETKLAIKAAYKAEKRTLKDSYRAEKDAAKGQRKLLKQEIKNLKYSLK